LFICYVYSIWWRLLFCSFVLFIHSIHSDHLFTLIRSPPTLRPFWYHCYSWWYSDHSFWPTFDLIHVYILPFWPLNSICYVVHSHPYIDTIPFWRYSDTNLHWLYSLTVVVDTFDRHFIPFLFGIPDHFTPTIPVYSDDDDEELFCSTIYSFYIWWWKWCYSLHSWRPYDTYRYHCSINFVFVIPFPLFSLMMTFDVHSIHSPTCSTFLPFYHSFWCILLFYCSILTDLHSVSLRLTLPHRYRYCSTMIRWWPVIPACDVTFPYSIPIYTIRIPYDTTTTIRAIFWWHSPHSHCSTLFTMVFSIPPTCSVCSYIHFIHLFDTTTFGTLFPYHSIRCTVFYIVHSTTWPFAFCSVVHLFISPHLFLLTIRYYRHSMVFYSYSIPPMMLRYIWKWFYLPLTISHSASYILQFSLRRYTIDTICSICSLFVDHFIDTIPFTWKVFTCCSIHCSTHLHSMPFILHIVVIWYHSFIVDTMFGIPDCSDTIVVAFDDDHSVLPITILLFGTDIHFPIVPTGILHFYRSRYHTFWKKNRTPFILPTPFIRLFLHSTIWRCSTICSCSLPFWWVFHSVLLLIVLPFPFSIHWWWWFSFYHSTISGISDVRYIVSSFYSFYVPHSIPCSMIHSLLCSTYIVHITIHGILFIPLTVPFRYIHCSFRYHLFDLFCSFVTTTFCLTILHRISSYRYWYRHSYLLLFDVVILHSDRYIPRDDATAIRCVPHFTILRPILRWPFDTFILPFDTLFLHWPTTLFWWCISIHRYVIRAMFLFLFWYIPDCCSIIHLLLFGIHHSFLRWYRAGIPVRSFCSITILPFVVPGLFDTTISLFYIPRYCSLLFYIPTYIPHTVRFRWYICSSISRWPYLFYLPGLKKKDTISVTPFILPVHVRCHSTVFYRYIRYTPLPPLFLTTTTHYEFHLPYVDTTDCSGGRYVRLTDALLRSRFLCWVFDAILFHVHVLHRFHVVLFDTVLFIPVYVTFLPFANFLLLRFYFVHRYFSPPFCWLVTYFHSTITLPLQVPPTLFIHSLIRLLPPVPVVVRYDLPPFDTFRYHIHIRFHWWFIHYHFPTIYRCIVRWPPPRSIHLYFHYTYHHFITIHSVRWRLPIYKLPTYRCITWKHPVMRLMQCRYILPIPYCAWRPFDRVQYLVHSVTTWRIPHYYIPPPACSSASLNYSCYLRPWWPLMTIIPQNYPTYLRARLRWTPFAVFVCVAFGTLHVLRVRFVAFTFCSRFAGPFSAYRPYLMFYHHTFYDAFICSFDTFYPFDDIPHWCYLTTFYRYIHLHFRACWWYHSLIPSLPTRYHSHSTIDYDWWPVGRRCSRYIVVVVHSRWYAPTICLFTPTVILITFVVLFHSIHHIRDSTVQIQWCIDAFTFVVHSVIRWYDDDIHTYRYIHSIVQLIFVHSYDDIVTLTIVRSRHSIISVLLLIYSWSLFIPTYHHWRYSVFPDISSMMMTIDDIYHLFHSPVCSILIFDTVVVHPTTLHSHWLSTIPSLITLFILRWPVRLTDCSFWFWYIVVPYLRYYSDSLVVVDVAFRYWKWYSGRPDHICYIHSVHFLLRYRPFPLFGIYIPHSPRWYHVWCSDFIRFRCGDTIHSFYGDVFVTHWLFRCSIPTPFPPFGIHSTLHVDSPFILVRWPFYFDVIPVIHSTVLPVVFIPVVLFYVDTFRSSFIYSSHFYPTIPIRLFDTFVRPFYRWLLIVIRFCCVFPTYYDYILHSDPDLLPMFLIHSRWCYITVTHLLFYSDLLMIYWRICYTFWWYVISTFILYRHSLMTGVDTTSVIRWGVYLFIVHSLITVMVHLLLFCSFLMIVTFDTIRHSSTLHSFSYSTIPVITIRYWSLFLLFWYIRTFTVFTIFVPTIYSIPLLFICSTIVVNF